MHCHPPALSEGHSNRTLILLCAQIVGWLKRRGVHCVRIEKRATHPKRFFKVGDNVYPGQAATLKGLGLTE